MAVVAHRAAMEAGRFSLLQVGEKARKLEADGQVSLAAEMAVLEVSKPLKRLPAPRSAKLVTVTQICLYDRP